MLGSHRRSRSLARAAALALGLACTAAAGPARADYFESSWSGKPEPICPLFFGSGCRTTLSLDLVLAHQPTMSDDNGKEQYLRAGVEVGMARRFAEHWQLGPVLEFGAQDGQFMTGFHVVPKARARYWIAGSPVALELAAGGYYGRAWLDTGDAPRNLVGAQLDAGIGLFGTLHLVGGFAALADPSGLYGVQTQVFVGARVSFLALFVVALLQAKR